MPLHDWTRVDAGLFHDFHQSWAVEIKNALNGGLLPADYLALVEQHVSGPIPDVLTLRLPPRKRPPAGGVATLPTPAPAARSVRRIPVPLVYARKANRVTVRHRHGEVVAVIEIVSPGNKATANECKTFVTKAAELLAGGVSLLVVDVFPPGKHDPDRLHEAIWADPVDGGDRARMAGAPAINHTDEELEFLARLIGERTAWQISGVKGTKSGYGGAYGTN